MGNREDSIVLRKAFDFAIKIVEVNRTLNLKKEFVLSNQLLRSGTSVGANINEALSGVSKRDFQHKMGIAFKEANETEYWLKLLKYSNTLETDLLIEDVAEIRRILAAILVTTKSNQQRTQTNNN
ncbi:MAG: four helix bundle protein [Bacteroidia bacterium]|nr:four helix bundle protein [Bacteroidia bacterium]